MQDATKKDATRPGDDEDEVWNKFGHTEPTIHRFEQPRAAPAPPSVSRSTSQREPSSNGIIAEKPRIDRSQSQRVAPPSPYNKIHRRSDSHRPAVSQQGIQPLQSVRPAPPPPSKVSLSPVTLPVKSEVSADGLPIPRKREKKPKMSDADVVDRLKQICTDADPTKLYRSLTKIGQG